LEDVWNKSFLSAVHFIFLSKIFFGSVLQNYTFPWKIEILSSQKKLQFTEIESGGKIEQQKGGELCDNKANFTLF
jgi:hypothetical protein